MSWEAETKRDIGTKVALFLISPFFAFLYSLGTLKRRSSYIIIFLFSVCFGIAFTVDNFIDGIALDGVSYRIDFERMTTATQSDYMEGLRDFLSLDGETKDYYFDTVAFFLSRITGNYHVLFMLFAAVFAYFQLKTLRFLTLQDNYNNSTPALILVSLFLIIGIFNINGVRMWTGAWVGLYAMFQIFVNRRKRYTLLILTTPFFHGSYAILVIMVAFGMLMSQYKKPLIVLFICSFFVSVFASSIINGLYEYLPIQFRVMADNYATEESIANRSAAAWRTGRIFGFLEHLYWCFLVVVLSIKRGSISKEADKMFGMLLVLGSFVNIFFGVPSVGVRFQLLLYPLLAYVWLNTFGTIKYNALVYLCPIVFTFYLFINLRYYGKVLDESFFISNPLILVYKYLMCA